MKNQLVVSALGSDRPGIVNQLAQLATDSGCNIDDSRMTTLGKEFAVIMLLSGEWNALAKLEHAIPRVAQKLGLTTMLKRTTPPDGSKSLLPYSVQVVALDNPGIMQGLSNFFSKQGINITELYTESYSAPHTGTPLISLHMTVAIPHDCHIATLRESFMQFCEELNLDAILEPVKV